MTVAVDLGTDPSGRPTTLDLEELLATRLLVQGNSGSGKSHLLRRLLEGSARQVQQVVIDPEGDFTTLSDAFGHVAIDVADHSLAELARMAERAREHRTSVVLNLENLDVDGQLRAAAAFLAALFEAPREQWYPVLVVVDEAQLFAPAAAGEVADDARRVSLAAMTNLMCRGRKRGLAGVIATQRLAKLAKNVAAEASNFLMGRTFLDIDMARAADLLGMERRQADAIRDLARGEFLALGPAIARRPVCIRIGAVATAARNASPRLMPLPDRDADAAPTDLFAALHDVPAPPPPPPAAPPAHEVLRALAEPALVAVPPPPELDESGQDAVRADALRAVAAESSATPVAQLHDDYLVRCRMRGVTATDSLGDFARLLAMARAGLDPSDDWADVVALLPALPDQMWPPFLAIAGAARNGAGCPDDDRLAALYGTGSPSRARRMLGFIEGKGLVVVRIDLTGRRTMTLPHLGWTTAPSEVRAER